MCEQCNYAGEWALGSVGLQHQAEVSTAGTWSKLKTGYSKALLQRPISAQAVSDDQRQSKRSRSSDGKGRTDRSLRTGRNVAPSALCRAGPWTWTMDDVPHRLLAGCGINYGHLMLPAPRLAERLPYTLPSLTTIWADGYENSVARTIIDSFLLTPTSICGRSYFRKLLHVMN